MALLEVKVNRDTERRVVVDKERCAGCRECIVRCPVGALDLDVSDWVCAPRGEDCVGCRTCERTCPYGAIEVTGPARVASPVEVGTVPVEEHLRHSNVEVHPGLASWDEAIAEAERCLGCPDPTCRLGCPAHNNIPSFIEAIRGRDLARAHEILRQTTLFPDICSRVCDQSSQCEGACAWNLAGSEPVRIGLLERFVADMAPVPPVVRPKRQIGLSVAVVGAGPGGLAVAWDLLQEGAEVVVYEREAKPLGVLEWGIPEFTLPDAVAERPVRALEEAGLRIVTGVEVGRQKSLQALLSDHNAVVFAHGASLPLPLQVKGADAVRVEDATTFLRRAKDALRQRTELVDVHPGAKVLVIGAGNTAMDVARSARRFGADVLAVEWMDRRFAKVRPDELEQAEREGVRIRFNTTVQALEPGWGELFSARLGKTRQKSAQDRPEVLSSPPEEVGLIQLVVVAMGYRVDATPISDLKAALPLRRENSPAFRDRRLMATGLPQGSEAMARRVEERTAAVERAQRPIARRVYAVGDALTGPATVVAAMAQGRAVARAIAGEWRRGGLRQTSAAALRVAPARADAPAQLEKAAVGPLRMTSLALLGMGFVFCLTVVGFMAGALLIASGAFLLLLDILGRWVHHGLQKLGESPQEADIPALGRGLRT